MLSDVSVRDIRINELRFIYTDGLNEDRMIGKAEAFPDEIAGACRLRCEDAFCTPRSGKRFFCHAA